MIACTRMAPLAQTIADAHAGVHNFKKHSIACALYDLHTRFLTHSAHALH